MRLPCPNGVETDYLVVMLDVLDRTPDTSLRQTSLSNGRVVFFGFDSCQVSSDVPSPPHNNHAPAQSSHIRTRSMPATFQYSAISCIQRPALPRDWPALIATKQPPLRSPHARLPPHKPSPQPVQHKEYLPGCAVRGRSQRHYRLPYAMQYGSARAVKPSYVKPSMHPRSALRLFFLYRQTHLSHLTHGVTSKLSHVPHRPLAPMSVDVF